MPLFQNFQALRLDTMNETDVRETVVRPLIEALGYRNGEEAYVRSERVLRYDRAFLGRQNPKKDPPLVGRADYECGVAAHGRWIVEVKSPAVELTADDAAQGHSYAAHNEIAAEFYLLTNGHKFRLYQTSFPDKPVFEWQLADTAARFDILENLLGPEAIRKRAKSRKPDTGRPLGKSLPSCVRFVGGVLTYTDYRSRVPESTRMLRELLQGHRASVTGGGIVRGDDGLLRAKLYIAGPYAIFDEFNRTLGIDGFGFECAADSVSSDRQNPTIFQCHLSVFVPAGKTLKMPGLPTPLVMPFGFRCTTWTEAIGFCDGDELKGVFEINYTADNFDRPIPNSEQVKAAMNLETSGEFSIKFV